MEDYRSGIQVRIERFDTVEASPAYDHPSLHANQGNVRFIEAVVGVRYQVIAQVPCAKYGLKSFKGWEGAVVNYDIDRGTIKSSEYLRIEDRAKQGRLKGHVVDTLDQFHRKRPDGAWEWCSLVFSKIGMDEAVDTNVPGGKIEVTFARASAARAPDEDFDPDSFGEILRADSATDVKSDDENRPARAETLGVDDVGPQYYVYEYPRKAADRSKTVFTFYYRTKEYLDRIGAVECRPGLVLAKPTPPASEAEPLAKEQLPRVHRKHTVVPAPPQQQEQHDQDGIRKVRRSKRIAARHSSRYSSPAPPNADPSTSAQSPPHTTESDEDAAGRSPKERKRSARARSAIEHDVSEAERHRSPEEERGPFPAADVEDRESSVMMTGP